jgi:zinc D-Ala-D-Ala dipeptidase
MRRFNAYIYLFAAIGIAALSRDAIAGDPLVDVRSVDPTIVVELRYAGRKNLVGYPLYPRGTRALVRPEAASGLAAAQAFLRRYQFGLKIWDAYRPVSVQEKLWQASKNNDYVANPEIGVGSLHSWGVAVDATLVDAWNRPVRMPSDFDNFTPAAMWRYMGSHPDVRAHVHLLQAAMLKAGFWGLRTEWWHFTIANWQNYLPDHARRTAQVCGTQWQGKL